MYDRITIHFVGKPAADRCLIYIRAFDPMQYLQFQFQGDYLLFSVRTVMDTHCIKVCSLDMFLNKHLFVKSGLELLGTKTKEDKSFTISYLYNDTEDCDAHSEGCEPGKLTMNMKMTLVIEGRLIMMMMIMMMMMIIVII